MTLSEMTAKIGAAFKRFAEAVKKLIHRMKPWCVVEVTHDGAISLSKHWTKADAVMSAPPRENIYFLRSSSLREANFEITGRKFYDEV